MFKEIALRGYELVTRPGRRALRRRLTQQGKTPSCVLFYHRIADTDPNDWTLDFGSFRRQIEWLKQRFDLVSLEELQRRNRAIASGDQSFDRLSVSITFDDGYSENCDRAIPFLLEQGVPFTYFVSLDFVQTGKAFPHDERRGRPLRPNTIDELRSMASAGVEISGHTRTHCDIGCVDTAARLFDEVVSASRELQSLVGSPVRYFAFPYGQISNLSSAAVSLARQAGFMGICSAFGAYNFADQDPFHLRRFHADREWARFINWMTIDPRKCHLGRGFRFPQSEVLLDDWSRFLNPASAAPIDCNLSAFPIQQTAD